VAKALVKPEILTVQLHLIVQHCHYSYWIARSGKHRYSRWNLLCHHIQKMRYKYFSLQAAIWDFPNSIISGRFTGCSIGMAVIEIWGVSVEILFLIHLEFELCLRGNLPPPPLISNVRLNNRISNPNILRRFTRRVSSLSHLSYLERVNALKLEPLELKRIKFDLMQYYKVLINLTYIELKSYFHLHYPPPSSTYIELKSYFHLHYPPPSSRFPSPFLQQSSNVSKNLQSSFIFRYLDCGNALYIRYPVMICLKSEASP